MIPILYNAAGLVVCDKPAGPPTTGATPQTPGSIEYALARQLHRPVWAVHQLDRNTSGCNLFVLKKSLVQTIAGALAAGQKTYLAVVHGAIDAPADIDAPIGIRRDPLNEKTFPTIGGESSRAARTRIAPLSVGLDRQFTLVAAWPATGRTHQIRLHLAALGHPLVGEHLHRDPPCDLAPRHFLHAFQLILAPTPTTPALTVTSPLPADITAFVNARIGPDAPAAIAGLLPSLHSDT